MDVILYNKIAKQETELHGVASVNMFNKNDPDVLVGKYIEADGVETTATGWGESGFIPCKKGSIYTFTNSSGYFLSSRPINYYDENKNRLSGVGTAMPTITISNENYKYFRVPIKESEMDNAMIVENNSTILPYVPYGVYDKRISEYGGITKKVIEYDENLFGDFSMNMFNKDDPDMLHNNQYIDASGEVQTMNQYNETGFIPCEYGDTFTFTKAGAYYSGTRIFVFYDGNKNFISGRSGVTLPTITISEQNAKYFRAPIKNDELAITMITKNDTRELPYVPYGRVDGIIDNVNQMKDMGTLQWKGKSVVCFGDSIMYNDGHDGLVGYPHYIRQCGFYVVTNKGVNGACVAYHEGRQAESICTTVDSVTFTNYDLVIIEGGINDYNTASATPIGSLVNSVTLTDFDKTTFIGALQYIISKILTGKNSIKIALMTPLKKSNWFNTNSEGKVLKDYADAMKEVAEYYSIPVLDFYSMSGLNRNNMSTFLSDGLHPNNDGYEFISKCKLTSFINGL